MGFGAIVDATQGTFTVRGVPPGHYRLWANIYSSAGGTSRAMSAEIPLDVGGSDVDGLDLALDSGSTVDVTFQGDSDASAMLRSENSAHTLRGGSRDKDGGFHFEGVLPGRYWLNTSTSEDTCVESVKLGDSEMRGAPFDLAAGAALHFNVAVSHNCGSIRIRALRDGEAVPGAKVVLLVSGTPKDPGALREDFSDDEGEFSFAGLAPGRYLVWAWAVEGKGAMTGPASLAAVEQQATVVDVTPGPPVHVDVPLLTEEGKAQ
jgi:hypothetical protein